jgi:dihydroxy-acid dehydratase
MAALRESGVMPQVFGTITVADGISMGTEGMKYSLVSREVIADSIETGRQRPVDGRCPGRGRLRQEHAGRAHRLRAARRAAIFVYAGTIKPGCHAGPRPHDRERVRGARQFEAGKLPKSELDAIERAAIPGVGACGGCSRPTRCPPRSRRSGSASRARPRWRPRTRRRRTAPRSPRACSRPR